MAAAPLVQHGHSCKVWVLCDLICKPNGKIVLITKEKWIRGWYFTGLDSVSGCLCFPGPKFCGQMVLSLQNILNERPCLRMHYALVLP